MKKVIFCCFLLSYIGATAQQAEPLFNGKNLNGWYSFLRSKGKNNDPEKVFSIENGTLHISEKSLAISLQKKSLSTSI